MVEKLLLVLERAVGAITSAATAARLVELDEEICSVSRDIFLEVGGEFAPQNDSFEKVSRALRAAAQKVEIEAKKHDLTGEQNATISKVVANLDDRASELLESPFGDDDLAESEAAPVVGSSQP